MGKDLVIWKIGKKGSNKNYYISNILKPEGLLIHKQLVRYEDIVKQIEWSTEHGIKNLDITLKNGESFRIRGIGMFENMNPRFQRFYSVFKEAFQQHTNCSLCSKIRGENICPDCDRRVCSNCWDTEMAICVACKKKLQSLRGDAPEGGVSSAPAPPTVPQASVSDPFEPSRLIKLRNALQMSDQAPINVMTKSFGFNSSEEFISWIFELGIPGLKIDYDTSMIKKENEASIETLNSFIDASMK